jgi:IS30 family transposase
MPRAVKREIFDRLVAGETWVEVSVHVGVSQQTIWRVLRGFGGLPPRWRDRRGSQLTFEEREEISRGCSAGLSVTAIAVLVGKHKSTVSREVRANGGRDVYRAVPAEQRAWQLARRPKASKLVTCERLRAFVIAGLLEDWSPEQISGTLVLEFPDDAEMRVSPETIYQSLFVQAKGVFKRELCAHLRSGRTLRQPRTRSTVTRPIKGMVNISERPGPDDRSVPGDWEGDLIIGRNGKSATGTLVERSSRFVMLLALPDDRRAETVSAGLAELVQRLPLSMRRTLTWDQGSEMADHVNFTIATNIQVYFCDPRQPWQRGTNENTNGLLRQYLPKSTDLSVHTQADLDAIADKLNRRPRKTLGFMTPSAAFNKLVATTA